MPWTNSCKTSLCVFRALPRGKRLLVVGGGAVLFLLLVAATAPKSKNVKHIETATVGAVRSHEQAAVAWPSGIDSLKEMDAPAFNAGGAKIFRGDSGDTAVAGVAGGVPRVTYSAEVGISTKEFVRARSTMEEILERHRGYVAKMRMMGQSSGSVLSATLRIPATEYALALSELKAIGNWNRMKKQRTK